ncbi:Hypothetical predicted protein [Pelobates cultripes]|uniref:Uncharacterized protein n=1 Tax=Pelobates cultripes TaxID=61616 RepID=A0AAD1VL25_PELCU|nr:Hypothetical predicted protein [Pelobates cultripes]
MASTPSASGAPSTSTLDGIGEEIRTIAASMATMADLLVLTTTCGLKWPESGQKWQHRVPVFKTWSAPTRPKMPDWLRLTQP